MVFDPRRRLVTCASAGHHAAVRLTPNQLPQLALTSTGRVLGLLPADDIGCETLPFEPGETLVLFTDGVSEAFGPTGELFGEERLLAHLRAAPGGTARETTLGVLEAVRRHAAGTRPSDDITIVSVRHQGAG
jgi:sigma-B regulation protein RsbU (phosphoserine phosphatase)